MKPVLAIATCLCLIACSGGSSDNSSNSSSSASSPAPAATTENTGHQLARYLQNWASGYKDGEGNSLFTGVVSVDDAGTTFKVVTSSAEWNVLSSDEQDEVKQNAKNAVYEAYCLIPSHHGDLVPGIDVKFIDDSGSDIDWVVTGPGQQCS